jgi:hypothetical protein
MQLVEQFRAQAQACTNLGSPMYAALLRRLADDLEGDRRAATTLRSVLAGHEDDPGPSALALRLLGSVHRLVLAGRAPQLAAYYSTVGGRWEVDAGHAAFLRLLDEDPDAVREWLDRPPQTNEVGRAAALMGGLLLVEPSLRKPVRLFEIGASGGLNLLAERFCYRDGQDVHGDPGSPVRLEDPWRGHRPPPWTDLRVVERVGGDVAPVDVATVQGRLTLTAYVWPDQTHRHARLRGAFELAAREPVTVRRQGAVDFVEALELQAGALTVLWHSVMWQYLSREDQDAVAARIQQLGARASTEAPFAHLFLEPTRRTQDAEHEFLVVLTTWPGGRRRVLGTSVGHGLPTTWE